MERVKKRFSSSSFCKKHKEQKKVRRMSPSSNSRGVINYRKTSPRDLRKGVSDVTRKRGGGLHLDHMLYDSDLATKIQQHTIQQM